MQKIQWSESLSVGVSEIDEQHRKLIGIINDLIDAEAIGSDSEIVSVIISRLVDYIDFHFGTEETYMTRFHFTGLVSHRNEHRVFIRNVFEMRKHHVQDKEDLLPDILAFLTDWLRKHIAETDAAYSKCFLENGLK